MIQIQSMSFDLLKKAGWNLRPELTQVFDDFF